MYKVNWSEKSVKQLIVNGVPFAVVPFDEYQRMRRELNILQNTPHIRSADELPHEIVQLHILKNYSLPKAWRIYLRLTQKEAAEKIGISQAALSKLEKREKHQQGTLQKIADAYGISIDQLTLDD